MLKLALVSLLTLTLAPAAAFAEAPPTLVQNELPLRATGWYIAPTAGFTSLKGDLGYVPGLRGAVMLNERFGAGLAVNFLGTGNTRLADHDVREVGAYGGAYLQYVLRSTDVVHAYLDATLGRGGWCQQSVHDDCDGRSFALVEPTVNVEVNITRNLRLAVGVGYRLSIAEKQNAAQSRTDFSGVVARTSVVLGAF